MLILRPLICPPKLVSLIRFWVVWMYVNKVSAASGASEHSVWGVYRRVFARWFQWHHRRPCPTSAAGDIAGLVWNSVSGLRGLLAVCVRYQWTRLCMVIPMTPLGAVSDIGGRRYYAFWYGSAPRSKQKLAVFTRGGRAVPDFETEVIGNFLGTLERGFHRLIIQ